MTPLALGGDAPGKRRSGRDRAVNPPIRNLAWATLGVISVFHACALRSEVFFEISSTCSKPRERLTITLHNASNKTIDTYNADLTIHYFNGEQERERVSWSYVDPGRSLDDHVSLEDTCLNVAAIRLRKVTICEIDSKYYSDCMDYTHLQKLPL